MASYSWIELDAGARTRCFNSVIRRVTGVRPKSVPLLRRIFANCNESRTLTALRDALLPKLLSGELRVKQAEKLLAVAS